MEELHSRRFEKLSTLLGEYMLSDSGSENMSRSGLPLVIARAFRLAAQKASLKAARTFHPLSLLRYADGQQMLSITGVILPRSDLESFVDATQIERWEFYSRTWDDIEHVEVPYLTLRERMSLDQLLPKSEPDEILQRISVPVAEDETEALNILRAYKRFYRFYPQFHHVSF
jgi:hypothetical protein